MKHRWVIALVAGLLAISAYTLIAQTWRGQPWELKRGLDLAGGIRMVLQAETDKLPAGQEWTTEDLNSIIRIIRSRVDGLGVSEPIIQRKGTDQVVVELPDIEDQEEAKKILQSTARLEFRHLWNVHYTDSTRHRGAAAKYALEIEPTETGERFAFTDPKTGEVVLSAQVLGESKLILTGDDLKPGKSRVTKDNQGLRAVVALEFTSEGRRKFADFTRKNVNEILAIVLDDEILSAPHIKTPILQGNAIIEGSFTPKEAQQLADLINAGALPVPLHIVQTQVVEATLGQSSVDRSIQAGIVGLIAVIIFMVGYYALPGLVADVALAIYAVLTIAFFKLFGVTLTLPGIAAYILSIGMAVDANVLIFERLKEELRSGKTLRAAIDAGFARAFTSIFDSNMCTLITCVILGWLGTGSIRGFALVLGVGVLLSMFTAITVTRTILHLLVNTSLGQDPKRFGVDRQWVAGRKGAQIDIVGRMAIWFALSAIVLAPGLYFWLGADGLKYGIDFTGGSMTQVQFSQPASTAKIDKAFSDAGFPGSTIQKVMDKSAPNTVFIRTKEISDEKLATVQASLRELGGTVQSSESVGQVISEELKANAIKAIIFAAIAIIAYLSIRFAIGGIAQGFRFGVCAVAATLHDVLVIVGFFAIMGHFFNWELDSLFVTAALTIIGFSTHDTIVIFDRIRENLRHKTKGEPFAALVSRSILQSFARSINTSLTVLLTLGALWALGPINIRQFVIALFIGVVTGTYSSIFNASQLLVLWQRLTDKQPAFGRTIEPTSDRTSRARELKPLSEKANAEDEADESVQAATDLSEGKSASARPKAKKRKRRF